jgi:hypothetical protein
MTTNPAGVTRTSDPGSGGVRSLPVPAQPSPPAHQSGGPTIRPDIVRARTLIASGALSGATVTDPCSCGAARIDHAGASHKGGCPATGCRRYRPDAAWALAAKVLAAADAHPLDDVEEYLNRLYPRPPVDPGGWGVGASDYLRCRKQIQYRENPPADLVPEPVDTHAATLGSIIHDLIRRARERKYWWRHFELPVTIPGLDRTVRLDEYDYVLGRVDDWKTNSLYAWEEVDEAAQPAHEGQGDVYGYGMAEAGYPVNEIGILYINRSSGKLAPYRRSYSKSRAEAALDWLTSVNLGLDTGVDMERDYGGPSSDERCVRCPFVKHCWNVEAAEAAGRSPEGYTILGPSPEAAKIEWAARRVWDRKQAHDAAKTAYEESRYLLRGIPSGVYGGFEVVQKSRRMPEWKKWAEQAKAALGDGADPKYVIAMPPPRRTDRWVDVKPVHTADQTNDDDSPVINVTDLAVQAAGAA